jgi:hypothetical protein
LDDKTAQHFNILTNVLSEIIYEPINVGISVKKLKNTRYTQKNGAVSKINKKCISHLTQAKHTPSAASKFLMRYQQFASHAYCGAAGPVSKMASHQDKAFCVLCVQICDYSAA